ncbi:MAG TPA: hypothetical protein VHJ20_02825 [Polyangia bacterium]|nr:hypothetical protein [Polyangia bacterium]
MKRFASALACTVLGLACAPAPMRVAVATTPVHGVPTPPRDCTEAGAPYLVELCAMHEPPLSVSGPETYRFLWMRHQHNPVAVRAMRSGEGVAVFSVESNAQDPRDERRHEFQADVSSWKSLRAHLDAADFWNLAGDPDDDERGLDGADWVLEGRRGGIYHAVVRWNPPPGPFRAACEDLIRVAGVGFPAELR